MLTHPKSFLPGKCSAQPQFLTPAGDYISNREDKNVPSCYIDLHFEVAKNTPIVGIMQSNSRMFVATLKSFLDGSVNIFEDKDVLDHLI